MNWDHQLNILNQKLEFKVVSTLSLEHEVCLLSFENIICIFCAELQLLDMYAIRELFLPAVTI